MKFSPDLNSHGHIKNPAAPQLQ